MPFSCRVVSEPLIFFGLLFCAGVVNAAPVQFDMHAGAAEEALQHWPWLALLLLVIVSLLLLVVHVQRLNLRNQRIGQALKNELAQKEDVHHRLLAQSEKLNSILESIAEAYFTVNNQWQVIDMNGKAQELLHKGRSSLAGENLWSALPELASFAYSKFTRSIKQGEALEFTAYYPPENLWLEFHTFPSGSEMSVYFRDVSARVRSAEKIEENRQRLTAILDNILEGVITIDVNGTIQTFNYAARKIFAYEPGEVLGKNVAMLMPEGEAGMHDRFIRNYVATGKTKIIGVGREIYGKRRDGELFPLEIAVNDVIVQGQRMFIAIMRDVSERKRAEQKIARLVSAMRYAADGIFITDMARNIEFVNPAYEAMTGYAQDELEGQRPWLFEQAHQDRQRFAAFFTALAQGQAWHGEYAAMRKDGASYEEEATIAPVQDNKGETICYIGVCRDISEKLAFEQRLRQADKLEAVAKMAGSFAHEFNNLLASIVGYTDMVLYDADGESELALDLGHVLQAANRAKVLVSQLLDFSQQEYEQALVIMPQRTVSEVVHLLRNMLPSGVQLEDDIADVCEIRIPPAQFQQVVMNIGIQALESIEAHDGHIAISLRCAEFDALALAGGDTLSAGEYAVLSVRHNGQGIARAQLDDILDSFASTHAEADKKSMGLVTAHRIVSRNGGAMTIDSTERETTLTVYLPCVRDEAEAQLGSGI